MNQIEKAIVSTLSYAHIFNSALRYYQLYSKLESPKIISPKDFNKNLKSLLKNKVIIQKNSYYFLTNSEINFKKQKKQIQISQKKYQKLKKLRSYLHHFPFVKAVLVTGSIASLSSQNQEDIDLLIITAKNRLWLTRFLLNIFLDLKNLRRHPKKSLIKNKLCLNVFLETSCLCVPSTKQNLFIANEIIQALPLNITKNLYCKFIKSNLWIRKYLPNSFQNQKNLYHISLKKDYNFSLYPFSSNSKTYKSFFLDFLNFIFFKLQYFYMKPKITNEIIKTHQAFFHPQKTGSCILKKFRLAKNKNIDIIGKQ